MSDSPTLRIVLAGRGAESLTDELDAAGIEYNAPRPREGLVLASADWINFANHTVATMPWAGLALVLVQWLKGKAARKIVVTRKDGDIVHFEAQGISLKEMEKLLRDSEDVAVMDTKPDPLPSVGE